MTEPEVPKCSKCQKNLTEKWTSTKRTVTRHSMKRLYTCELCENDCESGHVNKRLRDIRLRDVNDSIEEYEESIPSSEKPEQAINVTVALTKYAGLDKAVRKGFTTFLINDPPSPTRSSTRRRASLKPSPSIKYNNSPVIRSRISQPAEEVQVIYQAHQRPSNLRRLPSKRTN